MPRRMPPALLLEQEPVMFQVITKEPQPLAGLRAAEVAAGGRGELEEDPAGVGAKQGEKEGDWIVGVLLCNPIGVGGANRFGRDRRYLGHPSFDIEQLQAAMLTRVPVRTVQRQEIV